MSIQPLLPVENMICTICSAVPRTSTISLPIHATVEGEYVEFDAKYDTSGKLHTHNPNIATRIGECSNGHTVTVTEGDICPEGDYGSAQSIVFS